MDFDDDRTQLLMKKDMVSSLYGKQSGITPKVTLTVEEGPDKGKSFQFSSPEHIIGRGADSHFKLTDPSVSSRHAIIFAVERGVAIVDLKSKNSTLVNGRKVEHVLIRNKDEITLGNTKIRVRIPVSKAPKL